MPCCRHQCATGLVDNERHIAAILTKGNYAVAKYQLTENEKFSDTAVSNQMFGVNFVASADFEFTAISEILEHLKGLGTTIFRFPGGTVTEAEFTELSFLTGNWGIDTYLDKNGNQAKLMNLVEFFLSLIHI